jgi:hypothetical protein
VLRSGIGENELVKGAEEVRHVTVTLLRARPESAQHLERRAQQHLAQLVFIIDVTNNNNNVK